MQTVRSQTETVSVGGKDSAGDPNARVVFYKLGSKVVGTEENLSDKSKEIVYYTLSVGHNTGVLDCFNVALQCSYSDFESLCSLLPAEDYGLLKLSGLRRFGEITIDSSHAAKMLGSWTHYIDRLPDEQRELAAKISVLLGDCVVDPVVYLIVKRLS